eukprot:CAMPEP_0173137402 /NCGR_PEP_ID=MMETSP1105-20130129/3066_1 /TAXON_ID=2985 /ORGANISM="Ochromonas sp., Strain BG-1" /LENGTH=299 /DNA_ID=CAMNT_0014049785 /DNA_START=47 /DNA_END=946 /DNA_ORIENTATION=-
MNLAEATALLQQREELKAKVEDEILQYCGWKEKGYDGLISFTVFQVEGFSEDASFSLNYGIAETDTFKSENTSNLLVNDKVEVFIKEKTGYTDINCKVTLGSVDEEVLPVKEEEELGGVVPSPPSAEYFGRFYFQGVPDEGELRDIVEAKTDGERLTGSEPYFHIKISYDNFDAAIRSRELEIEQIDKEIHDAKTKIKDAQKVSAAPAAKPAAATKKTTVKKGSAKEKKPKKKTVTTAVSDDEPPAFVDEEEQEPQTPLTQRILEAGIVAVDVLYNNRAYLLFGIASVGIYAFGDYASV